MALTPKQQAALDKATAAAIAEANKLLAEEAAIRKKISESAGDYLKLIKDIKELNKNLTDIKKQRDIQAEIVKEKKKDKSISAEILAIEEAKLKIIEDELAAIERMTSALVKAAKSTTTLGKAWAFTTMAVKDINTINKSVQFGYGKLKNWAGLFEMDKPIRMAGLSMGILSKQSDSFRTSIELAANQTASFGVGIAELAKMQQDYSEELGRSVQLGKEGLVAMGKMAAATGLGADGAAKMAADFENQGYSAERTADFVEQTMNDTHKMGLNASKVVKNIAGNMKMLNKYNFKGGVKGLAKMAETASKLGVDMNMVSGMADKLFDIEGAVDMSAQLQVMGGAWAKLADPFKLMYMARNDMEGLMEAVGGAAAESAHFNKESKTFEISALEMHRLRKVAEQTGVSYEELAQAAKNAAKFTKIKSQISFNMDKDEKEFLINTAKMDANGKAYIEVDGSPKFLNQITSTDKAILKAQIAEKASSIKRAEDSQTFDEKLSNLMKTFKQLLLPLLTSMDKGLRPVIQKFTDTLQNPKTLEGIRQFASVAGTVIASITKFVANNPVAAIAAFGMFEVAKWMANGVALGIGFKSVTGGGGGGGFGGGMGKGLKGVGTGARMIGSGRVASGMGTMVKGFGKAALPLAAIGVGIDAVTNAMDDNLSITDKFLKTLDQHKFMASGAAIGSIIPGVGTAVGAGIGGLIDMFTPEVGKYGGGVNDGIFNSPIHDGKLGGDFNKGRGIIQGGKITPIDNKDDLLAMKPKGPVDRAINSSTPSNMKIEFGDIHFTFDELKVTSPGSPGVAIDLIKDPQFIRNITRMVHSETEKVVNGGKNRG